MPHEEWINELGNEFRILVRRVTRWGNLEEFAVVLIYQDECVTRYDTAHGRPHRDVLGKRIGLKEKVFCENMSYEEAFRHAIIDISNNYEQYLSFWQNN